MPLRSTTIEYKYTPNEIASFIKEEIARVNSVPPEQVDVQFEVNAGGVGDRHDYSPPSLTCVKATIRYKK